LRTRRGLQSVRWVLLRVTRCAMPPPLPVTFAVLALVTGNAMREVPPLRVTPEVLVILKSPGGEL